MGLFDFILNNNDNYYENLTDDQKQKLEDEMDALDLEEWQKDLVREGKYNPEDFEEEVEDEDDYYYDDEDDVDDDDEEEEDDEYV